MMLEEFHGVVTYDFAVISYLELMQQPLHRLQSSWITVDQR